MRFVVRRLPLFASLLLRLLGLLCSTLLGVALRFGLLEAKSLFASFRSLYVRVRFLIVDDQKFDIDVPFLSIGELGVAHFQARFAAGSGLWISVISGST